MHVALTPYIINPIGVVLMVICLLIGCKAIFGIFDRQFCKQPKGTSFIKSLWYDPFVYMLVSFTGIILLFVTPLIVVSHPIPMKNFDEHVTVQGHNVTIEDLPKAYSLYSESGDSIDRISGEYKDGKLIVDGAEYELSKSDIKYLDRKVKDNESN